MGLKRIQWGGFLLWWVFCILCFKALCDVPEASVKFLQAPSQFSRDSSATFVFDAHVGASRKEACSNCSFICKLDGSISSDCGTRNVSFVGLKDGNHSLEICANSSQGAGCATYSWIIDTVHPTAYISTSTSFTNAVNISVYISFTEPCTGGDGFRCSSVDACNLLVYGAGKVIPNTLQTIQPNLTYSIVVGLSAEVEYGRVILVMDKGFCTDRAGNRFIRPENSSSTIHFDRRSPMVSLRTHVPERLLELNGETRTVQATNDPEKLKVYLYFNEPVLNTSTEIMKSIHISQGLLRPINSSTLANRRFGYQIEDVPGVTVISVDLNSSFLISRQGTPVSPVAPATFLYDSTRPAVQLRTGSKMRTRDSSIVVSIKFLKPVFGFNSTHVSVSGGHLDSFEELSRSLYIAIIQAYEGIISVSVPENLTADVAGNPNLASNILQMRHYSLPMISTVLCIFVTALFVATCFVAGLLTICTASLQSAGTFPRSSATLTSNATKNLFRIVCYIQVFALSRWLGVTLPVEYDEFTRCIEWIVPYFNLPYESNDVQPAFFNPNTSISSRPSLAGVVGSYFIETVQLDKGSSNKAGPGAVYGAPLTVAEYQSIFENQNFIPEAIYITDHDSSTGWWTFKRSMFWLAVIGGSLILLHAFLLLVLRFRKSSAKERSYGALIFLRFEIFLAIAAAPCICLASTAIIKGGTTLGIVIGVLLLILVSFLQLSLFLFLTFGITLGRFLQYKEVHKVGKKYQWYQELVRVSLGPGKRGQWTWKNQPNCKSLTMFGPMFEDLRGPPKYMLSMISSGGRLPLDSIIASDDENEDAEAPFIQKVFGILRIYYTLLESLKRFILGILSGVYVENAASNSRGPTLTLLCITSFQLFFLCLKKPYIKKKVQLVEIISIACELGLFATCLAILDRKEGFSIQGEKAVGIFMLCLFIIGFVSLMCNEWYALFKQVRKLDTSQNSFRAGLRTAAVGFFLLFLPEKLMKKLEKWLPEDKGGRQSNGEQTNRTHSTPTNVETTSSGSRSSCMSDNRPWLKQLREMAKASFKEGSSTSGGGGGNDEPSTSGFTTKWSGFWRGRGSGSSSKGSGSNSSDFKAKPRSSLYKDLEAIFASNK